MSLCACACMFVYCGILRRASVFSSTFKYNILDLMGRGLRTKQGCHGNSRPSSRPFTIYLQHGKKKKAVTNSEHASPSFSPALLVSIRKRRIHDRMEGEKKKKEKKSHKQASAVYRSALQAQNRAALWRSAS